MRFFYLMVTFHIDQADIKFKLCCMACRYCVQIRIYLDGIDAIVDTQMLKTPDDLLVYLSHLENGKSPDIETLKK